MPPSLRARKTWRTLEPLHGMVYFVPEAAEAYARLGITGRAGYFASRAAPMGAVHGRRGRLDFFNFNPELVHAAIPAAWEVATPAALVAARFDAVDAAFRRLLGDEVVASAEMQRAAELARHGGRGGGPAGGGAAVGCRPRRRGLARAPHLVLWHAQSILREYRGDGHIAQLVVQGLSGLEALVTHAAAGDVPEHLLRSTRGWPQDAWDGAVETLQAAGWLEQGDELRFTASGAAQRQAIEEGTDALAAAPYAVLGDDRCAELRALARPWSTTFAQQLP